MPHPWDARPEQKGSGALGRHTGQSAGDHWGCPALLGEVPHHQNYPLTTCKDVRSKIQLQYLLWQTSPSCVTLPRWEGLEGGHNYSLPAGRGDACESTATNGSGWQTHCQVLGKSLSSLCPFPAGDCLLCFPPREAISLCAPPPAKVCCWLPRGWVFPVWGLQKIKEP